VCTALVLITTLFSLSCSSDKNVVWVYTSIFPETLEKFEAALKKKYPDLKIKWFQNGSENVAAKLALEQLAGDVKADLVVTADIFWFKKMEEQGFWDSYKPNLSYDVPDEFEGKDGTFTTPRISVMAMGYNKQYVNEADAPKSFQELADSKWKGKVSSGSPLESGTNYALMINLANRYGYEFLTKLRENDLMAAGGNSAVLKRIVTGERPVGLILIESLLNEQKNNPNIGIIYPQDGVIFAPGPMGIPKAAKNKDGAKKVYDFLMSDEGQRISVEGLVHVPDPNVGAPAGAKPLAELKTNAFDFSEKFMAFVKAEEKNFKDKFANIMFE
jgi:iron(III) transport system substrate-binding protein